MGVSMDVIAILAVVMLDSVLRIESHEGDPWGVEKNRLLLWFGGSRLFFFHWKGDGTRLDGNRKPR